MTPNHPRSDHPSNGGDIQGNVQGEVGWGSEQPDLAEDVPAHRRGVGSLPTQTIL